MNREEVFSKVADICKSVFEDDNLQVSESTTAEDIEAWDSLTHLTLVSELEEAFEVSFTLEEVTGKKNLGELVTALMNHIGK